MSENTQLDLGLEVGIPSGVIWISIVVILCAVLTIGITGCGLYNEDPWVGSWTRETFDDQTLEQWVEEFEEDEGVSITITANSWTFSSDGSMEQEFALKGGSLQGSVKATGIYWLSGSDFTLTFMAIKATGVFNGGEIKNADTATGVLTYTGTWHRQGNTLTLNVDDDAIVLRKR